jgi:hypothetical protein
MEDIDTALADAGNADATDAGGELEYVAVADEDSDSSLIETGKKEAIFHLERTIERLEAEIQRTPTLENYLELSNIYLALGTITRDKETLQKAVDKAEEVIRLKEKDRPLIDNAEQNKRAVFDRMGGYSYNAVSTAAQIVGDAADMFTISPG